LNTHKAFNKQKYQYGDFSIVPIRVEDRYDIMRWRSEQMYHLRQNEPLTEADQDRYFDEVVSPLFDEEKPDQILFSFLEGEQCIGYGGLVHINWLDLNAEVSFIMNTSLEPDFFSQHWETYLQLLDQVAFSDLKIHKLFVYAFDLRPHLYPILEEAGFFPDARLTEHCLFNNKFIDVVIHSKLQLS